MKKTAIVQFDNRSSQGLGQLINLASINRRYSIQQGYHHFFINRFGIDIPPYWVKCMLVYQLLNQGFEVVMWMDTDAVVHNLEIRIEEMIEPSRAMAFSGDTPQWQGRFNAGVFICQGPQGKTLMREWISLYPANLWSKIDGNWVCKDEEWAGRAYEQGAFIHSIIPRFLDSGLLQTHPWETLQSPYPLAESFTLHFSRGFTLNTTIYLNQIKKMRPDWFSNQA